MKMKKLMKYLKKGTFIIVKYEGEYYPGKVDMDEDEKSDTVFVSVMEKSGLNNWKWPNKPDKLWYDKEDVAKIISSPKLINKRGVYKVDEMKDLEQYL